MKNFADDYGLCVSSTTTKKGIASKKICVGGSLPFRERVSDPFYPTQRLSPIKREWPYVSRLVHKLFNIFIPLTTT